MEPPLPAELICLVLQHLPPNYIALNGRRAFRGAAHHFSAVHHRTVRLASQRLPRRALQWVHDQLQPFARSLTLRQKLKLLAVAAASGCVVNMTAVWGVLRPHLFPELLPPSSASQDPSFNYMLFLPEDEDPGRIACERGHPNLVPWMVQHGCPLAPHATLQAAARHCDLDTLRSLTDLLRPLPGAPKQLNQRVLEAAAASGTCDTLTKRWSGYWVKEAGAAP